MIIMIKIIIIIMLHPVLEEMYEMYADFLVLQKSKALE